MEMRYLWAVVLGEVKPGNLPSPEVWARIVARAEVERDHEQARAEDWIRGKVAWVNSPEAEAERTSRKRYEAKHGQTDQAALFDLEAT